MTWTKLKDGGGTDFERELMRSAFADAAPDGARERVAERLGLNLPGPAQAPSAAARTPDQVDGGRGRSSELARDGVTTPLGGAKLAKLGVIAISGGLALYAAFMRPPPPPTAEVSERKAHDGPPAAAAAAAPLSAPHASPADAPSTVARGTRHGSSEPSERATSEGAGVRRSRAEPEAKPRVRTRGLRSTGPGHGPVESSSLMREVALLDETRAALRSGAGQRASALLDRYAARFPHGELALEAAMLRVQTLGALERRGEASALAREVLTRPGSERYRSELERHIESASSSGSNALTRDIEGAR